jgi:hypothetical protein
MTDKDDNEPKPVKDKKKYEVSTRVNRTTEEIQKQEKTRLTKKKASNIRTYSHFSSTKRNRFLKALELTGNVNSSAASAGVTRATVYALIARNAKFKDQVQLARDKATGSFEAEAHRRAVTGVKEPVFHRGEEVGSVTKYSDTLLQKLLEASDPERYGKRSNVAIEQNITITGGSAREKLASMLKVELDALEGEFEQVDEDDD